jgi:hypothetical protein
MSRTRPESDRDGGVAAPAPTWSTWREAIDVISNLRQLRRSMTIALIVGTVLFGINQLDVVLRGDATAAVWMKVGVTYLVPFCVANAGLLAGTRRAE